MVLVVEDDEGLALAISKILEREGLRTLIASSGKAALEHLTQGAPAMMLVDYSLGDTRADRLIELLSTQGRLIPFVVATGHGSETIAVEMMKRGARDYLVKDGSFLQLLPAVVTRVLSEVETERRLTRAEQALRDSEQRYRNLVEHAPDAIYVSQAGRLVFVNAAMLKLFGADSADQLIGRSAIDLIHPEHLDAVRQRMQNLRERGHAAPLREEKMLRLDGGVLDVEVTATPCLYNNLPSAQVIVRDIAERKQAQAQAREHQAQLAHVMRVNTMGKMVSELAHEINQPLYAIANYAAACRELLTANRSACPPDVVSWIEQIADQANRAGEIIRHVGGFVRKAPPHRSTAAINDVLRDIVRLLELDARSRAARIQLSLQPETRLVLIDRVQIEQVIVNLVLNAIEAMEQTPSEDRQVTITCSSTTGAVEVAIQDLGKAVDGNNFRQLFEPFFTTKPGGMGMGLAISRSIVDSHGGRLWATANPVRGMTFHFTLPVPATEAEASG